MLSGALAAAIHILNYKAILQQPELSRHLTDILDVFVDVCVRNVERTGGSIAKFINGSCMAPRSWFRVPLRTHRPGYSIYAFPP